MFLNQSALRSLNPMIESGLVKVGGRIDRAPVSYEMRHPCILPSRHHVTELVVQYYHQLNGHCGLMQVLALVRERYWIIKGRSAVRRILGQCLQCRKCNALKGRQHMASLPPDRLTPDKLPSHTVV